MTHTELENELITLDRRIEVLELLIDKTQCGCFTPNDEHFHQSNLYDLKVYKERKQYLLTLQGKSESVLSVLPSHPIVKVCIA